jgi:NadR type nicotinamide-nucleotide adenylyltransferase
LIQWASLLAFETRVILVTQPGEPYGDERYYALVKNANHLSNVRIHRISSGLEENPDAPGFWTMWKDILINYGCRPGDIIVASEDYGKRLAEDTGARFMPYDPDRSIDGSRATNVRLDYFASFTDVMPEFQPSLMKTVTFIGAESTGKTTLSKWTARGWWGHWLPEWARPYLEHAENVITVESMTEIWKGQRALQEQGQTFRDKPFVIQDTDLFSTVGYWEFWSPDTVPAGLVNDAKRLKSDLYIITQSNIPFEVDPLRYGGDKRESDDQYWINLCHKYDLPFVVIKGNSPEDRHREVNAYMHGVRSKVEQSLKHERRFQPLTQVS